MADTYNGYCVKCKEKRDFEGDIAETKTGMRMAKGKCPVCGTGMFTLISAAASGADVRGVFSYQPVADYNIIVKDAKIGLKDLGGKSFASSGPLDMTDNQVYAEASAPRSDFTTTARRPPPSRATAP